MKLPKECSVFLPIKRGMQGRSVRLIQEWLCLHDHGTMIDGEYGPATEAAVRRFQTFSHIHPTGLVDEATMKALLLPMMSATKPLATTAETLSQRVLAAARQHHKQRPRALRGVQDGPWIRLYTGGSEGPDVHWNAAFVSYLLDQATEGLPDEVRSFDTFDTVTALVTAAIRRGVFVPGTVALEDKTIMADLRPGNIVVRRHPERDDAWTHCGIVAAFLPAYIETIEVAVDDAGRSSGVEVTRRFRGYSHLDFVKV